MKDKFYRITPSITDYDATRLTYTTRHMPQFALDGELLGILTMQQAAEIAIEVVTGGRGHAERDQIITLTVTSPDFATYTSTWEHLGSLTTGDDDD